MYKERSEKKRAEYAEKIKIFDENEIHYIDEVGIDEFYEREYGYAPENERVYGEVLGRKFKRTSIVAAKQGKKIVAPFEYEGTMDGALFEGWFEQIFLKKIPKNSVIVLDGATFHRRQPLYDLAHEYECTLIFLPPYSPDLNPIEKTWANLKNFLRNYSRNFKTIQDAIMAFFQD